MRISILIPAYNEEKTVEKTILACLSQSRRADQIVVVDDGSTDGTARILKKYDSIVTIVTCPTNTGNKSYAQETGLKYITGEVFITTDADTILDRNFVHRVETAFVANPKLAAFGGYVKSLPYNWLTACRELDYILGQDIHKVAQSEINALFVIPGCAGAFRTFIFRNYIGFDHDTLTEDLDFTYKLNKFSFPIVYDRVAVAYTQDPPNLPSYIRQMRRWYRGGWQNIKKHKDILKKSGNALELSLMYIEGGTFAILLALLPLLNIFFFLHVIGPYFAISAILGLYGAIIRRRIDLLLYSPFFIVLIYINAYIFISEFIRVIILQKMSGGWLKAQRV